MALCVVVDSGTGAVTSAQTDVTNCAGYVLLEPYEYQALGPAFQPVDLTDFATCFAVGFIVPVTAYLVALGCGILIKAVKWW